ncbi:MAG TPA: hypothetical protein VFL14_00260, partial [Xanthomonadales bacterium]|nr:hypothetical protein [Xanthomonadales bacterium]
MILGERMRIALQYAGPIVLGLLVSLAGFLPWVAMARLNARVHPELPWAAIATLAWLVVYIAWLHGIGPPAKWRAARRWRLRLWRAGSIAWTGRGIGTTLSLMAAIGLLTVVWIAIGSPAHPPDLHEYRSTAYLVSVVVMGA